MKSTIRFTLGIVATLLLSAGLTHAAEKLDPLSREMKDAKTGRPVLGAADCTYECAFAEGSESQGDV